jgi:hypothetical protein
MCLPAIVGDDELVVSFVLESGKFKAGGGLDHRQLMPSNKYGNTFIFRIESLSEVETAEAGHELVALPRNKLGILGWAELIVRAVRAMQPLIVNADEPPPRHALIEGWPQAREQQRTLAILLASKVRVVQRSTIPSAI